MTLIVLIPTATGLVAAADSRVTVGNLYCDIAYKLIPFANPSRSLAFVTGSTSFMHPSGTADICNALIHDRRPSLPSLLKKFIEAKDVQAGSLRWEDLRPELSVLVKGIDDLDSYFSAGNTFKSRAVMASYENDSSTSLISSCIISIESDLVPRVDPQPLIQLGPDDMSTAYFFGESEYVMSNVAAPLSLGFYILSDDAKSIVEMLEPTRAVSKDKAIGAAIDIVDVTSATSNFIPAPSGIGGPVDVLFLGANARPEKVQWKAAPN